jgi:hypothetical protein
MEKIIRNFFMLMVAIMVLSACGETELTHYNNIPAGPSISEQMTCGNGVLEKGEGCDGKDFAGKTCAFYGYERGELTCADRCLISVASCHHDTKSVIINDDTQEEGQSVITYFPAGEKSFPDGIEICTTIIDYDDVVQMVEIELCPRPPFAKICEAFEVQKILTNKNGEAQWCTTEIKWASIYSEMNTTTHE